MLGRGMGLGLGLGVRLGMYASLRSCVMLSRILSTKSLGEFLRSKCSLNLCRVDWYVCASVFERKNLIASPFTSPLKMPLG